MKKMISLALGAVAVLALSGCNSSGVNDPWNGSGNSGSGSESLSNVDIKKLNNPNNGYIILGYDYMKQRKVEFDFCGKYYDYYRQGASTQSGHFNIANGKEYVDTRINFWMNGGHTSYRIDTEDDNDYGNLFTGHTYQIKFQNEEIHIERIYKWDCR